ncbi:outer membrane beta-barrel protein [Rhodoflexus sp.]
MKSNERKFEDIFRDAFENAELAPSAEVWKRIEREVAKKPRLMTMPRLKQIGIAAAIALFALSTSYFGYRYFNAAKPVAIENTTTQPAVITTPNTATIQSQDNAASNNAPQTALTNPTDVGGQLPAVTQGSGTTGGTNKRVEIISGAARRNIAALPPADMQNGKTDANSIAFLPSSALQMLPVEEYSLSGKAPEKVAFVPLLSTEDLPIAKSEESRRGWIGLMVARNEFNPGFSRVSNVQPTPFITGQYAEASIIHNDLTDSLFNKNSVSLQIDGGYFIGRKLAIRSGLAFMRNSYSVNTSAELILPPFLQGSAAKANSIEVHTQMLSVPLQLAYVSQGKFGYQFSAGIAGDITLGHTIHSRRVEGVEYTFGNYKAFNISGLAGVGLFYNFTPHLGIQLDANYRRSLNSVYQTPHLQANPQWISFGGGLLYKF